MYFTVIMKCSVALFEANGCHLNRNGLCYSYGQMKHFFKNTHFIGLAGMTGENAFCVSWAPCGIVALTKKNKINL